MDGLKGIQILYFQYVTWEENPTEKNRDRFLGMLAMYCEIHDLQVKDLTQQRTDPQFPHLLELMEEND